MTTHRLLAALASDGGLGPQVPGSSQDLLILLIACAGLGLVILLVATLWFKGRKNHRHHHRRDRETAPRNTVESTASEEPGEDGEADAHSHGRRRRRRAHRSRNPTLAETGGLPPPRPEGQVPHGL